MRVAARSRARLRRAGRGRARHRRGHDRPRGVPADPSDPHPGRRDGRGRAQSRGALGCRLVPVLVIFRPTVPTRLATSNVNDKPTGAVVGQQTFGGSRTSGTNDNVGTVWILVRFVSPLAVNRNTDGDSGTAGSGP